ncbi:MAG: hypothetical protein QOF46_3739, partial [Paraburkholderia sp.]|nr:hypothetical protein [Paraburkholderia sp.]
AEQQMEPTLLSFMRESRRLVNRRLKEELRVRLQYPSVADFLREVRGRRDTAKLGEAQTDG